VIRYFSAAPVKTLKLPTNFCIIAGISVAYLEAIIDPTANKMVFNPPIPFIAPSTVPIIFSNPFNAVIKNLSSIKS